MKKNEYQLEVGSLRLSDEFKEQLKEKMLKEYEASKESEPNPEIKMSGFSGFAKKYSKYAAIAAAFVIVASTVGVMSVKGLKSKKAEDISDLENKSQADQAEVQNDAYSDDGIFDDDSPAADFDYDDDDPDDEAAPTEMTGIQPKDSDEENGEPVDDQPDVEEEILTETPLTDAPETEEVDDPEYETVDDDAEQELRSYSQYASPGYEGSYNGDDYINQNTGSGENLPETVVAENFQIMPYNVMPPARENSEPAPDAAYVPNPGADYETPDSAPVPNPDAPAENTSQTDSAQGNGDNNVDVSEPTPPPLNEEESVPEDDSEVIESGDTESADQPTSAEPEAPAEAPADAPAEEPDEAVEEVERPEIAVEPEAPMPVPDSAVPPAAVNPKTSQEEIKVFSDYYDYRSSNLPTDGIALVRFTVEQAYSSDEIAEVFPGAMMDPHAETLYKINIGYDYFNSSSTSVERLLINVGSTDVQLAGRPVLEGEYIALVTEDHQGALRIDPNLLYKVYGIHGVDIAYHVTSESGAAIDPGSTNMGINPEEMTVYTTSSNNPEKYEQKSEVNELTRYLRRNILRLEPTLLDIYSGAKPPVESLTASYSAGQLKISIGEGDLKAAFPDPDGNVKAILESMGAVIGDKTCNVITKDGSKAHFRDGELIGIDVVSDGKPFYASVMGVTVGTSLDKALELLRISPEQTLSQSATVILKSDEADGGWTAELSFDSGVLTQITLRAESDEG